MVTPRRQPGFGKCYFRAADVSNHGFSFPVSRSGWTEARRHVYKIRDDKGAGYATLFCPGGAIPLYQCYKGQGCTIEGSSGDVVLAGARRRRRR